MKNIDHLSFYNLDTLHALKKKSQDFPGGPVVKASASSAGGGGSIPDPGTKIPYASYGQKNKT